MDLYGIPAKVYDPGNSAGVVLLGHGGGHGKDSERFVRLCRHYADATGGAVLCIDAVDHGERKPPSASPGLPPRWHSSVASQMVDDWRQAVSAISDLGPPLAYVGFSMGAVFGALTVAAMPTLEAAVFVVGGVPSGPWLDDPKLPSLLLDAASKLTHAEVLMINKTRDEFFPRAGVHEFFDAVPGARKRLMFWEGDHDEWPDEAIAQTTTFLTTHVA